MYKGSITDVPGILVGHEENKDAKTGCTVVLSKAGAVAGVDVRGFAPGTRETDLMRPGNMVDRVHGILLTGGSAYGLDAAGGIMEYLEEEGVGFDTGSALVPIVGGAVIYDLDLGDASIRPDKAMGYSACKNASKDPVKEGSLGAGTGASVGKILGPDNAMKGGIGSASIELAEGIFVGGIFVVNAFGDIFDYKEDAIIAGARDPQKGEFINTSEYLLNMAGQINSKLGNTTIGVIATNANINREEANSLASIAHDGLALSIKPVHTKLDGDTVFVLATGNQDKDTKMDLLLLGNAVVEVTRRAIINAVKASN